MPTSSIATVASTVPCPVVESLDAILPQEPLLMMGAGPVPIPAAVAKANTVVINHLGGTMVKVITQVKTMARYVFQTQSKWVLGVAGAGCGGAGIGGHGNGYLQSRVGRHASAVHQERFFQRPDGRNGPARRRAGQH